ncbi:hypothetical protein [Streptomyces pilosus]|uniref:hypothetical protein n=1 Tax=Streptomyces pilosus TaxID=28893 RepID=UPI0036F77D83
MRRARTRRRAAVAAVLAAAVPLLGACGIRATDVVEAGGPASVQAFLDLDSEMLLFFRAPDGGLSPVIRPAEPSAGFGDAYVSGSDSADTAGPVPTEEVVAALLAGPDEEDRAAGLGTALPAVRPGGNVAVEPSPDGGVSTRLPLALKDLDSTALRQLTCTIAYSRDADGQVLVRLEGRDGASHSDTCGLARGAPGNVPGAS